MKHDRIARPSPMPKSVEGDPIDITIGPIGELQPCGELPDTDSNWLPVRIVGRHPQWQAFRSQIEAYAATQAGNAVYAPLTHPDLQDIPCWFGHDRLDAVIEHLRPGGKTVLDLGAHWGYACERLERIGRQCTAIESGDDACYFMAKLRAAQHLSYDIQHVDMFEYIGRYPQADTVLALAIFHHYLKTSSGYGLLLGLLRRLETREVFLLTHYPDEPQMANAYRNMAPDEFAQLVVDAAHLHQYEYVGIFGGRTLFRVF